MSDFYVVGCKDMSFLLFPCLRLSFVVSGAIFAGQKIPSLGEFMLLREIESTQVKFVGRRSSSLGEFDWSAFCRAISPSELESSLGDFFVPICYILCIIDPCLILVTFLLPIVFVPDYYGLID